MRIQARLFLGTALLVLALMGVQWWLHARQLRALENELGMMATSVSKGLLTSDVEMVVERFLAPEESSVVEEMVWVHEVHGDDGEGNATTLTTSLSGKTPSETRIKVLPEIENGERSHHFTRIVRQGSDGTAMTGTTSASVVATIESTSGGAMKVPRAVLDLNVHEDDVVQMRAADGETPAGLRRMEIKVVRSDDLPDHLLVIRADSGAESRIPIPVGRTMGVVNTTLRQGLAFSGALLALGLVASGVMARRMARPLQDLAARAEALGEGELGAEVEVNATGEVGELQHSFNRMSRRLAELEEERERWRQREHLVQLGNLSRGLAHTLRNPLNTLGLAFEEMAGDGDNDRRLVGTARAQIRRIDRWLRSFLALGAGEAAEAEEVDLGEVVRAAVLEAVQQGANVNLEVRDERLDAVVVETAVSAALANLLENAAEVNPPGAAVDVEVRRDGLEAVVRMVDRGPGLPEEVRQKLFSPHVTTKVEGSGMGLFLARQLVVEMHGGSLELADNPLGGTVATVRLALAAEDGDEGEAS